MPMALLPIAGFCCRAIYAQSRRRRETGALCLGNELRPGPRQRPCRYQRSTALLRNLWQRAPRVGAARRRPFHRTDAYQIEALAASGFVVAPDSRAHGRSTDSDAPLNYAQMADDVLKLLDQLRILRLIWSDGASAPPRHASSGAHSIGTLIHKPVFNGKIPAIFFKRNAADPAHWSVFLREAHHNAAITPPPNHSGCPGTSHRRWNTSVCHSRDPQLSILLL
jgi:hypothetical protein